MQSIEPHRILAPTLDLNREPLGSQSRVVTTILPLHTLYYRCTHYTAAIEMFLHMTLAPGHPLLLTLTLEHSPRSSPWHSRRVWTFDCCRSVWTLGPWTVGCLGRCHVSTRRHLGSRRGRGLQRRPRRVRRRTRSELEQQPTTTICTTTDQQQRTTTICRTTTTSTMNNNDMYNNKNEQLRYVQQQHQQRTTTICTTTTNNNDMYNNNEQLDEVASCCSKFWIRTTTTTLIFIENLFCTRLGILLTGNVVNRACCGPTCGQGMSWVGHVVDRACCGQGMLWAGHVVGRACMLGAGHVGGGGARHVTGQNQGWHSICFSFNIYIHLIFIFI